MILDDKVIMRPLIIPPPEYYLPSYPTISSTNKPNLSTLPSHILLQMLHSTFPQSSRIPDQDTPELQRKTLYWLSTSLRLVNRALYTACMHILRSTYLRAYQALLKPPYSSDPFPISSGPPAYEPDGSPILPHQGIPDQSPLQTIQRETLILDRFITLKVREDVFSDESCLHLEGDDKFRDLFHLAQPQARLEDLVRIYGVREGIVSIPGMALVTPTGMTTGRNRLYASSLSSSSQSSLQPPTSPFHDSNTMTTPYLVLTHTPASIPQVATVSNPITTTTNTPPPPPPPPRSTGFFSTLKKLTYGSSSSPSSSPLSPSHGSPRSPSSPSPLQPNPNILINPNIYYPTPLPIRKPKPKPKPIQPLAFSSLSITLTFQSIRLIHKKKEDGSKRCVAEVPRSRGGARRETLEVLAEGLVRALKEGLEERIGE